MSLFPNLPPPAPPPAKSKLTPQERRAQEADRLTAIRLRMAIGEKLDERGIINPSAIAKALGIPTLEATKLLTRHRWRDGDVLLLRAVAARLGVQVPSLMAATKARTGGN